jgi:hypothetical protein
VEETCMKPKLTIWLSILIHKILVVSLTLSKYDKLITG